LRELGERFVAPLNPRSNTYRRDDRAVASMCEPPPPVSRKPAYWKNWKSVVMRCEAINNGLRRGLVQGRRCARRGSARARLTPPHALATIARMSDPEGEAEWVTVREVAHGMPAEPLAEWLANDKIPVRLVGDRLGNNFRGATGGCRIMVPATQLVAEDAVRAFLAMLGIFGGPLLLIWLLSRELRVGADGFASQRGPFPQRFIPLRDIATIEHHESRGIKLPSLTTLHFTTGGSDRIVGASRGFVEAVRAGVRRVLALPRLAERLSRATTSCVEPAPQRR